MEVGIPREGSNERTKARRLRRKASKAKKAAAEAAAKIVAEKATNMVVTWEATYEVPSQF